MVLWFPPKNQADSRITRERVGFRRRSHGFAAPWFSTAFWAGGLSRLTPVAMVWRKASLVAVVVRMATLYALPLPTSMPQK